MARIFYLIFAATILIGIGLTVLGLSNANGQSAASGTMIAIVGPLGAIGTFVITRVTIKKG